MNRNQTQSPTTDWKESMSFFTVRHHLRSPSEILILATQSCRCVDVNSAGQSIDADEKNKDQTAKFKKKR